VFELTEPERPRVDRAEVRFLKSEALHPADLTIREDGVVRLNPEFARRVADVAMQPTIGLRTPPPRGRQLAPPDRICDVPQSG
jgi:hypothetical protein